jgi:hypothetical protein
MESIVSTADLPVVPGVPVQKVLQRGMRDNFFSHYENS